MENRNVVEVEVDYAVDLRKSARHYGFEIDQDVNPNDVRYEYSGPHANGRLIQNLGKITRKMVCYKIEGFKRDDKISAEKLSELIDEMKKQGLKTRKMIHVELKKRGIVIGDNLSAEKRLLESMNEMLNKMKNRGFRPANWQELFAFAGQHGKDKEISFASEAIRQVTRDWRYIDDWHHNYEYFNIDNFLIINNRKWISLVRRHNSRLNEEIKKFRFVFVKINKDGSKKKMFRVTHKEAVYKITGWRYISEKDGSEAEKELSHYDEKVDMVEACDIEDALMKLPGLAYHYDVKIEEVKVIS